MYRYLQKIITINIITLLVVNALTFGFIQFDLHNVDGYIYGAVSEQTEPCHYSTSTGLCEYGVRYRFDSNGGEFVGDAYDLHIPYNETYYLKEEDFPVVVNGSKTLVGWSLNQDGSAAPYYEIGTKLNTSPSAKETVLYAIWQDVPTEYVWLNTTSNNRYEEMLNRPRYAAALTEGKLTMPSFARLWSTHTYASGDVLYPDEYFLSGKTYDLSSGTNIYAITPYYKYIQLNGNGIYTDDGFEELYLSTNIKGVASATSLNVYASASAPEIQYRYYRDSSDYVLTEFNTEPDGSGKAMFSPQNDSYAQWASAGFEDIALYSLIQDANWDGHYGKVINGDIESFDFYDSYGIEYPLHKFSYWSPDGKTEVSNILEFDSFVEEKWASYKYYCRTLFPVFRTCQITYIDGDEQYIDFADDAGLIHIRKDSKCPDGKVFLGWKFSSTSGDWVNTLSLILDDDITLFAEYADVVEGFDYVKLVDMPSSSCSTFEEPVIIQEESRDGSISIELPELPSGYYWWLDRMFYYKPGRNITVASGSTLEAASIKDMKDITMPRAYVFDANGGYLSVNGASPSDGRFYASATSLVRFPESNEMIPPYSDTYGLGWVLNVPEYTGTFYKGTANYKLFSNKPTFYALWDAENFAVELDNNSLWKKLDYSEREKVKKIVFTKDLPKFDKENTISWSAQANNSIKPIIVFYDKSSQIIYIYTNGASKVYAGADCGSLFREFSSITNIAGIDMLDTSKASDMGYMFDGCINLTTLDVSNFDTSNVTNMSGMFCDCNNLTTIDISGFDTSKVTNMSYMFCNRNNLITNNWITLDVSGFETSNVTNMRGMFTNCNNLITLDVSGFDTPKVTDMESMFNGCKELKKLDISNFDTSKVTDMRGMFAHCNNLTTLDVSGFDTSNVSDMGCMFSDCSNLTTLDVSGFDTSNVTDMRWMFSNCNNITKLGLSNFRTSNVTNMQNMFYNCYALENLDFSRFDFSNVKSIDSFILNTKLSEIKTSSTWPSNIMALPNSICEEWNNSVMDIVKSPFPANKADTYRRINSHVLKTSQAKPATCIESGWGEFLYCSRCGYVFSEYDDYPALGHELKCVDALAATCEMAGWNAYEYCTRCDYTTREEIPAIGHIAVGTPAIEPTCIVAGLTADQHCSACGKILSVAEEIPALGHTPGMPVIEIVEDVNGGNPSREEVVYCAVCDEELSRISSSIPKCTSVLGHEFVHVEASAATCEDIGWNAYYYCIRCSYTTLQEIPAIGHVPVGTPAVEATCIAGGLTADQHCSVCGKTLSVPEEIPALGHSPAAPVEENIIHAADGNDGSYEEVVYCIVCGEELSRELCSIPGATLLGKGGKFKIVTTMSGKLIWTTSDAKIATVSKGTVTGKGFGTATISVTNGVDTESYTFTIVPAISGVKLSASKVAIGEGYSSGEIEVKITDKTGEADYNLVDNNTSDAIDIEWTSDTTFVVHGEKATGKAVSIVISDTISGKSAKISVTVGKSADKVTTTLKSTDVSIIYGKKVSLKAAGACSNGMKPISTAVNWESSDESIATVNAKGQVVANACGTCTITAVSATGSGSLDFTVTVWPQMKSAALFDANGIKVTKYTAKAGEVVDIYDYINDKSIVWANGVEPAADQEVSYEFKASVKGGAVFDAKTGRLTCLGKGSAKITVTFWAGTQKKAANIAVTIIE